MATKKSDGDARNPGAIAPDLVKVNAIQAERLASLARLKSHKELVGATHAELAERLKWQIEPHSFLFRKVCGRVVKKDPVTGANHPVPNATVVVEDTDCGFVGYFPLSSQFGWFFPIQCRREVLATVTTDECGHFCVWIPRWDIDWVLRWRKERFCFPIIFERPSVFDILKDIPILVDERFPPKPVPGPDPAPEVSQMLDAVDRLTVAELTSAIGPALADRVAALPGVGAFGGSTAAASALLVERAFDGVRPPPLPDEFKQVNPAPEDKRESTHTMAMVRGTIAERLGVDVKALAALDLRFPIGPFKRCVTRYVPEWSLVLDVPDITFRVMQDVDGDGTEEVIYSEGYFDVRWNANVIPPVTLVAANHARESVSCEQPPVVCGNVSDIQFAGMMPLTSPYHSNVSGYALRPNRPRPIPPITPQPNATAPFCGNVNLFGCLVATGGATKYRLVYRYSSDGGGTFSPELPFTNVAWWWHPLAGPPVHATSDANGWYNLPPSGLIGPEVNLLFPFNTGAYAAGLYEIRVQVGTGGTTVLGQSSPKRLRVDNALPSYTPSVLWRIAGASAWNPLTYPCPLVTRGTAPQAVEFDVRWEVAASHYRNASISAGGCGSGTFGPPIVQPGSTASGPGGTSDWHQGPLDNGVVFHVRYLLPASALQGTYTFGLHANTRAFNPAGADANYQALDWLYDSPNGGRYVTPSFHFSVVNT